MWFQRKTNVREVINTYTWLSGRPTTKPCGVRSPFSFMKSQSLAAKPPTRNTDYTTRKENKLAVQWKQMKKNEKRRTEISVFDALCWSLIDWIIHWIEGSKKEATSDLNPQAPNKLVNKMWTHGYPIGTHPFNRIWPDRMPTRRSSSFNDPNLI